MDLYEEKYKNAVQQIRDLMKKGKENGWSILAYEKDFEEIFPELVENESRDERITREIKQFLKQNNGWNKEWFDWLEKQGEQKSFDNVEPKFKVGDFIKHNKVNFTCKVISVNSGSYYLEDIKTSVKIELPNAEQNYRLWTIQDAKDGDVLADKDVILIFRGIGNARRDDVIDYYCCYDYSRKSFTVQENVDYWGYVWDTQLRPATKNQRDIFFKKMKEAGYEWDADKKELRQVKDSPKSQHENKTCEEKEENLTDDDDESYADAQRKGWEEFGLDDTPSNLSKRKIYDVGFYVGYEYGKSLK